jgi:hypothetical protein
MNNLFKNNSSAISRRILLQGAAVIGSAPWFALEANPALAFQYSQVAVGYQDHPNGDQKCSQCSHFIKPHSCLTVEGVISPKGWCKGWITEKV